MAKNDNKKGAGIIDSGKEDPQASYASLRNLVEKLAAFKSQIAGLNGHGSHEEKTKAQSELMNLVVEAETLSRQSSSVEEEVEETEEVKDEE